MRALTRTPTIVGRTRMRARRRNVLTGLAAAVAACGGPPPPVTPPAPAVADGAADDRAGAAARATLHAMLADGEAPGVQYVVVSADRVRFAYAGGWADLARRRVMDSATTLMTYSMSKTFTAVAVLQLAEAGKLQLDDPVARYVPSQPYGPTVTIRQLLAHTGGLPNPLPLRWVHPAAAHAGFDDAGALDSILRKHADRSTEPGRRYGYSNIGYWLLGRVVERASGETFPDYMRTHVFAPLGPQAASLGYDVPDAARHARGYLERYSMMNLFKGFLIDGALLGEAEGRWVNIRDHHVNGAAFGGMVATAGGVAAFLQDQLRPTSALLGPQGARWLREQQRRADGELVPMTLGWHVDQDDGQTILYKEGGGGGFHAMMRLYPEAGVGTVLLTNATGINVRHALDALDAPFVGAR